MKRLTSPAAVLIVVVAFVAMINGAVNMASETLGTPQERAEAYALTESVAPEIERENMYNETVLPRIHEAEAANAVELTEARTANTMNVEWSLAILKLVAIFSAMAVVIVSSLVILFAVVLLGAMLLLGVIWRARQVAQLSPVAVLPGRGQPVQFPGLVYTPTSGARHALEPGQADEVHAQAVITKQVESIEALTGLVSGGVRFSYRGNGNRHLLTRYEQSQPETESASAK